MKDALTATYLPRPMGEGLVEDLAFIKATRQLVVCAEDQVEIWTEIDPGMSAVC